MAQVSKAYNIHPNTVGTWKRVSGKGPEIFGQEGIVKEYEPDRRARASRGQKGSGDRAFKRLLGADRMTTEEKAALVETTKDTHGLNQSLKVIGLPKSTWYYHQNEKVADEEI
jgi:hypothetical protein